MTGATRPRAESPRRGRARARAAHATRSRSRAASRTTSSRTRSPARAFLRSLAPALPIQEIDHRRAGRRAGSRALCTSSSRLRAAASISGSCPTPGVRRSPIRARSSCAKRIAKRIAVVPLVGPVVGRARADGLRHERTGVRVSRLPAGEGRRAHPGHSGDRGRVRPHRTRADLHRNALPQRGADRGARRLLHSRRRACAWRPISRCPRSRSCRSDPRCGKAPTARATPGGRRSSCCRPSRVGVDFCAGFVPVGVSESSRSARLYAGESWM